MKNQPLISCIIIFLNAGNQFFIEAIESIFAQTYDNWELLLVDDGSTDESTKIALQYAKKYPEKVRYLEHESHQNRGMSAARNLGIRHAQGEYIAFLDSDDVWLPRKLERQAAILESQPEAAMVCGPNKLWHSWTGNPEDKERDFIHILGTGVQPNRLYQPPTLAALIWRNQARTPGTCSVLIRRGVFEEVAGFEESFRGMYEDRVFFNKVYLRFPVYVIEECFDLYRAHSESCCAVADKEYSPFKPEPAYLIFLDWMADYLSEQSIKDKEVLRGFRRTKLIYNNLFLFLLLKVKNRLLKLKKSIKPHALTCTSDKGEATQQLSRHNSHIPGAGSDKPTPLTWLTIPERKYNK
ncbi:glycosyltransferase family 2 protein [Nostoc sp. DSM 114159]|jgi:glycosyltransferase involved in cell wall biosynthesis